MKILVICTQRIGDVLLITPLIRSLRNAYPTACIDALVFSDTLQILQGNQDINTVIGVERHTQKLQRLKELVKLWNQYDLSVSAIPSDRARIYGWAASKKHYGSYHEKDNLLAKYLMFRSILFDNQNTHTVAMNLKLCELLGIPKDETVVAPESSETPFLEKFKKPYAVVHPYPKFLYKSWTTDEWRKLLLYLSHQQLNVYISGSSDPAEIAYCRELIVDENTQSIAGNYSLADLTSIIEHAELYIGVDTSVTHLAASTGVKVIALYGPTNPVKWGPWPHNKSPERQTIWLSYASTPQHHSNVTLIQGSQSCIPCAEEGCERHINSTSECLTTLQSETVIEQIKALSAPG